MDSTAAQQRTTRNAARCLLVALIATGIAGVSAARASAGTSTGPLEDEPHPRYTINVTQIFNPNPYAYCEGDIQAGFHGPLVEENVHCYVLP